MLSAVGVTLGFAAFPFLGFAVLSLAVALGMYRANEAVYDKWFDHNKIAVLAIMNAQKARLERRFFIRNILLELEDNPCQVEVLEERPRSINDEVEYTTTNRERLFTIKANAKKTVCPEACPSASLENSFAASHEEPRAKANGPW